MLREQAVLISAAVPKFEIELAPQGELGPQIEFRPWPQVEAQAEAALGGYAPEEGSETPVWYAGSETEEAEASDAEDTKEVEEEEGASDAEEEAPLSGRMRAPPYRGSIYRGSSIRKVSKASEKTFVTLLKVMAAAEVDDADEYQTPPIDSRPAARPHWRTPPPEDKGPVAPPPPHGDHLRIWRPQACPAVARRHWRTPAAAPAAQEAAPAAPAAAPAAPVEPFLWLAAPVAAEWTAASDEAHRAAPQPAAPWPRGLTEIHRGAR